MKLITQLYYLLLCFIKFVFRGKANKAINHPGKILIVNLAKIGDMVCSTPIFAAIKEKYPECKVHVLGNSVNKKLLEYNSHIVSYIVFNNFTDIINSIKRERYDFALINHCNIPGLIVAYLAGIPLISAPVVFNGKCPTQTKIYRILSFLTITKKVDNFSYAPKEYLKMLEPINIFTKNTRKYLSFSNSAKEKIDSLFSKYGIKKNDLIVGLTPSAGNKAKLWSTKKFANIVDYLYVKYKAKIIIIGGERDKGVVKEMLSFVGINTKYYDTTNKLNIDELKAIISKMELFISADTGPIYIAEAFNVPTIDIVGPIDERVQPPIGKFHKIVKSRNRDRGVWTIMNSHFGDKEEARKQSKDIKACDVINEIDELISLLNQDKK